MSASSLIWTRDSCVWPLPDSRGGQAGPARGQLPGPAFRRPGRKPGRVVFGEDTSIDAAVGTIMDGPLSRGVVNAMRRATFHAWHDWAQGTSDPAYDHFVMGLRTGRRLAVRAPAGCL
jgi:hypothetical protein